MIMYGLTDKAVDFLIGEDKDTDNVEQPEPEPVLFEISYKSSMENTPQQRPHLILLFVETEFRESRQWDSSQKESGGNSSAGSSSQRFECRHSAWKTFCACSTMGVISVL
jgi:hypothetical protein